MVRARSMALNHFQTAHSARGWPEAGLMNSHPLEHRDEQVGKRVVLRPIESQVLAVTESAAGKEGRQICRRVRVSVSEVGAVQDHRAVKKRRIAFLHRLQSCEQF